MDRLNIEQLKIRRSQIEAELRTVDLSISLDRNLREDVKRTAPPTSAVDQQLLKDMFKRHTKVAVNWSGKINFIVPCVQLM